jgi:hypothetical protein
VRHVQRCRAGGEVTNQQKLFVLLAEIRQCINDNHLMAAQRKILAIEDLLREPPTAVPLDEDIWSAPDEPWRLTNPATRGPYGSHYYVCCDPFVAIPNGQICPVCMARATAPEAEK